MNKEDRFEEIFDIIDDKKCRYSTEESADWRHYKNGVLDGLEYQDEKMYSEEEVFKILLNYQSKYPYASNEIGLKTWFEKIKKK